MKMLGQQHPGINSKGMLLPHLDNGFPEKGSRLGARKNFSPFMRHHRKKIGAAGNVGSPVRNHYVVSHSPRGMGIAHQHATTAPHAGTPILCWAVPNLRFWIGNDQPNIFRRMGTAHQPCNHRAACRDPHFMLAVPNLRLCIPTPCYSPNVSPEGFISLPQWRGYVPSTTNR